MLRGIASYDHAGPTQILHRADEAKAQLDLGPLATADIARREQDLDERKRGDALTARPAAVRLKAGGASHAPKACELALHIQRRADDSACLICTVTSY